MKYPQLLGICAKSIKNNWCTGCNKLELTDFTGVEECEYVVEPREKIHKILGIGEQMKI